MTPIVGETVAVVGLGAKLVGRLLGSKSDARRLRQLTVRYWASALFELEGNVRALRGALDGSHHDLILRFAVLDALVPELCRLDPSPGTLSRLNRVGAILKLINDLYLTEARSRATPTTGSSSSSSSGRNRTWRMVAEGDLERLEREYEALRDALLIAARSAYDDDREWQRQEPELTPPALDDVRPQVTTR